ncbi:MAG: hypothetical protein QXJ38_04045 [Thermofilaceae archaeon]
MRVSVLNPGTLNPVRAKVYRNEEVKRVIAFIPRGHTHTRLILELNDQTLILQEATVAAIVRAYVSVVTHPTRHAVELVQAKLTERKPTYAEHQLVESNRPEEEVLAEAEDIWRSCSPAGDHQHSSRPSISGENQG